MNLIDDLKIFPNEEIYYKKLYNYITKIPDSKLNDSMRNLFLKSNLDKEILKKIWILSSNNKEYLNKISFFLYLKCIAIIQTGQKINKSTIAIEQDLPFFYSLDLNEEDPEQIITNNNNNNNFSNKIINKNDDLFYLSKETITKIEKIIENCNTNTKEILTYDEAINISQSSGIDNKEIERIYGLIINSKKKRDLNKKEFIVFLFLISKAKAGINIPEILPNTLVNYLHNNNTSKQIFDNKSKQNYTGNSSERELYNAIQSESIFVLNNIRNNNNIIISEKEKNIELLEDFLDKLESNINQKKTKNNEIEDIIDSLKSESNSFNNNLNNFITNFNEYITEEHSKNEDNLKGLQEILSKLENNKIIIDNYELESKEKESLKQEILELKLKLENINIIDNKELTPDNSGNDIIAIKDNLNDNNNQKDVEHNFIDNELINEDSDKNN